MLKHASHNAAGSTAIESIAEEPDRDYQFFQHPLYTDLGPISRGAFGDVRRVHYQHSACVLAMKVMRYHVVKKPHIYAHFLTEIEMMAELRHPSILPLHDWGEFDDGRLWFTMPEVRGCTFSAVLDELHTGRDSYGFLSSGTFRSALEILARVCQVVAFAHDSDIVHRDLKPENMMVDDSGKTFVIDWGTAKRLTPSPAGRESSLWKSKYLQKPWFGILGFASPSAPFGPNPNEHGNVVGTPAYMPPEQAFGNPSLQSPASDVYSLGATLYHLLAGRPAYLGSRAAAIAEIKRGAALPISAVADAGRPLPNELVTLCETAMQRAPAARRVGARAMAQTLLEWLDQTKNRG